MRWPRFTLLQLFLATALCGLLAGWLTQVWQAGAAAQLAGMEISPDGKWLAARYLGGETKVWDISGLRPREPGNLPLPRGSWLQMRFIAGDALLVHAAGGRSSELIRIDLKTRRATTLIRSSQPFYTWAASTDGTTAVTCGAFVVGVKPTYGVWDLAAGKQVGRHALPITGPIERLEIDTRGSTLVVSDATQTSVWACDVETGNVLRAIPSLAFSRWALSGDGETLWSYKWPAAAGAAQASVERIDVRNRNRAPASFEPNGYPMALRASQDGSRILVCSFVGAELWDGERQLRHWTVAEPVDFNPFSFHNMLLSEAWQMSSDGSRVVTTSGIDQIRVLDGRTGQSLFLVGGINRLAYTAGYSAGFIVWAIAWGLLSRRQRLKDVARGTLVQPKSLSLQPRTSAVVAFMIVLIIVIAVQLVSALAGDSFAGLFWWLVPLVALGVLAMIVLRVTWALVHPVSYARDQARLLIGERGRRDSRGMIHGWFLGRSTIEDCFPRHVEEVRQQASEILGREIQFKVPLLVIGVQRQEQFDRLHRGHVPHGAITVQQWGLDEVRIGEETCTRYAIPPCQGLRHAAALALLRRYWHSDPPQWLNMGLIHWIGRQMTHHDTDLSRSHCFLKGVAGDRLEDLWKSAFEYTPQQWREMILGKEDPQQLQSAMEASTLFASLSAYFLADDAGPRREHFLAFVRGLGNDENADAAFARTFGHSPSELYAAWRTWLDQQPAGEITPREELGHAVRNVLLPTIADSSVGLAERRRCILVLGGCGDLAVARPLIEILEGEEEIDLAAEAVWALRGISGRAGSDDPVAWRKWLAACSPRSVFLPTMSAAVETGVATDESSDAIDRAASRGYAASLPHLLARAPGPLRWAWFLWTVSGMWGVAMAVALSFYLTAWIVLPIYGIPFAIGLISLVRGLGRHWWGIERLPRYQTAALLGCDPLSAASGMITMGLLNTVAVRDFLSQANDASFRSR